MSPLPKIDANIILKLPLWQRLLILVFLWLIIIGAFYYFLYSGKLAEKKALATKLEGLKNTAAEKQRRLQTCLKTYPRQPGLRDWIF